MSLENKCNTKNFLCKLNSNLEIISTNEINNTICEFPKYESIIDGIEDIRY